MSPTPSVTVMESAPIMHPCLCAPTYIPELLSMHAQSHTPPICLQTTLATPPSIPSVPLTHPPYPLSHQQFKCRPVQANPSPRSYCSALATATRSSPGPPPITPPPLVSLPSVLPLPTLPPPFYIISTAQHSIELRCFSLPHAGVSLVRCNQKLRWPFQHLLQIPSFRASNVFTIF
jgi:hypothetical protein